MNSQFIAGFIVGTGAFLAGYALTYLLVAGQVRAASIGRGTGTVVATLFPPAWKAVAWTFYGTHGIATRTLVDPASEAAIAGKVLFWVYEGHDVATATELTSGTSPFVPPEDAVRNVTGLLLAWPSWPLVFLVPAVLLCGAGFLLGRRYAETMRGGAIAGASVVVGYGSVAAVGVVATRADLSIYGELATVGPTLVPGLALAGLAYPVVFGALGGAAANGLVGGSRRKARSLFEELSGRPSEDQ